MPRSEKVLLDDILEAIQRIEQYTNQMDIEDFSDSRLHQDAVLRNLSIIGEAVKGLSIDTKEKYSSIDWRKIAGLRDIVIHAYFGVDIEIIWDVVQNKLPELKNLVDKIISENY
jgi:uncharacterized protein with HEPN domain